MIDFIEYVVAELKSKRLSKANAVAIVRQFSRRAAQSAGPSVIHPLLHRNTSDLSEQRYSTTLTGQELFLTDHQVRAGGGTAHKVLPGVVYLEMARAAVEQALPERPASALLELHNVVWVQPIVVEGKKEVRIALLTGDEDHVEFEIYSGDGDEDFVHGQGRAVVSRESAPPPLDLAQLEAAMQEGEVVPDVVYATCARMGLLYGPSFRTISSIRRGTGQALSRLRLRQPTEDAADYVLHPALLDGALQTAVALMESGAEPAQPRLPFALERLRVVAPCTEEMVAWVRYASGSHAADPVVKLDLDLCDERGNVCVQMRGLSWRALTGEIALSPTERPAIGLVLAAPVWEVSDRETASIAIEDHHIILCDLPAVPRNECLSLRAEPEQTIAQRYSDYAVACFEHVQTILQGKPRGRVLLQIVVGDERLAGLSGLLKTAALENPQLVAQLIVVADDLTAEELDRRLEGEKRRGLDPFVRYERGERKVMRWQEVAAGPEEPPIAFHDRGVYLITGGLGGLGLVFAGEILTRTREAHVLLTGRGPWSAEKQVLLDGLSADGRVSYRQMDLGDRDDVQRLVDAIRAEHGRLDGILHSAGMTADRLILQKSAAEFSSVLTPKVAGTFHLDEATRDVELDFFVLFSALAGAMGNVGQADYATANAFMDQFAAHRNRQVSAKERQGRTRAIDWPLWVAGGMGLDPESRDRLRQATGMRPMQTAVGIDAFHRSLIMPCDQLLVVEGDLSQIRRTLLSTPAVQEEVDSATVDAEIDAATLVEKTQEYLRRQFSGILKVPPQKIDGRAALENYGIDSILAMKLTNHLETAFGSLPKTLFFEYQTIRDLAEYFAEHHAARLTSMFAPATPRALDAEPAIVPATPAKLAPTTRSRRRRNAVPRDAKADDPIAIIGLSGRYPEAIDIEAYWTQLREGKDCITEVPKSRWDWREFFSEDRAKSGHHYSKWGGFISGVDEFDPLFFNISPVEAETIDPQERLFLQHAWMAIEDAGYTRASLQIPSEDDLPGQVGVYVGVMYNEYQLFGAEAVARGKRLGIPGSAASVANRVSYALNLHGPSMTLDTMCSSSLTAIHVACQDLRHGRTSLAIAGGVNVTIHPNKYLVLSDGQFISSDGHCQSFGEGGDGYIPGEGVGVVVLKRLSEAERDGDHIYGVIRGSALTHGGKTNGYSVPNPQAQASAISRALADARTDARHISYLEAHGTGTKLGDPIEIAALSKAFGKYTRDTGYCMVGSAKSNIGHCESAAGIAGLTKVLLQMQHRQIAPSLHSVNLNPHIDFAKTPFVVNQTLRPWEPPVIDGRTLPRIAGLSSFGAGGSNAHMIIEEHQPPVARPVAFESVLIVLSARTAAQLEQKARELLDFVLPRQHTIDLASMAYTLQVGREAMEERLGFVVSSTEAMVEKLQAYLAGEQGLEDIHRGQVKRNDDTVSLFSADGDLRQAVDRWIASRKLSRLLELWVKGLDLQWSELYGDARPRRMSLPTYPFARERYWIDTASTPAAGNVAATAVLHPLLHSNTSDLTGQRYRSTFTGDEFFLADHQVAPAGQVAQKVLPGVAYLEMARAAIERALPAGPEATVLKLQDAVWTRPIVVTGKTEVNIALFADDEDRITYEIYSEDAEEEIVHCQGRATFSRDAAPAVLDLARLRSETAPDAISPDVIYATCARMGLVYGPSFRGITGLQRGSGHVLAQLRLPRPAADAGGEYVLHPSLMDGALQAAVGLLDGETESSRPRLPFALDTLSIVAPCTAEMFAWVRYAAGSHAADPVVRLDIDLCDPAGNVCVQMRGLSSRALSYELGIAAPRPAEVATEAPQPLEPPVETGTLAEKTEEYLRRQLAGVLKLPSHKIDPHAALEEYGIDSVLAMKLTNQLEKTFGTLSKTLFFEFQTIHALAGYFTSQHAAQVAELLRPAGEPVPMVAPAVVPAAQRRVSSRRFRRERGTGSGATVDADPIAIIGLSGRYPEAVDVEAYWRNLRDGKDCITEVPSGRWEWREYFSDDRTQTGRHYSKWGGFIAGVDQFDPLFFNISPVDAELIDPQERLFLQHAWMAIEDAGYTRAGLRVPQSHDLPGQVGVYVGVMYNEYQLFAAEANAHGRRLPIPGSTASVANRVSYCLNLHGPSVTLDTMCSSSLTAIHFACQDLKLGRTNMAIAGGVNVSIHPNKYLVLSAGQFISSDGHCQSFGEGGDGYIPGEGVGVVVLKRLSEAKRDGDHIYGVIRGSALNHGGKTNGYTVPNPQAQASAISRALVESRTDPRHVSYIEAHGTGTTLGDPIEIAALSTAFQQQTSDTAFCLIGSAKSNIGHCESAAGIAGLTKVLLQFEHRQIVPSLHSAQLNPHIDFARTPFIVNQALRSWEQPVVEGRSVPRIAGISSFGAGGSNAHVIVEEYQTPVREEITASTVAILLSARTPEQLRQRVRDLVEFLQPRLETIGLAAMAYTLQVGREAMEERLGLVVSSAAELLQKLESYLSGERAIEDVHEGQVRRGNDALSMFSTDADLQQTVEKWIAGGKLSKLLDLWVKGLEIDWSKLYPETKPPRISLPVYPFAMERYWIDTAAGQAASKRATTAVLHPLLHTNTSDLSEQRYRSTFTGEEFFLVDHQVKASGRAAAKVLPGVAHLEMARAAIEQALPERPQGGDVQLRDVVWTRPMVVGEAEQVHIALTATDGGQIDYQIFTEQAGEEIVHGQGRAELSHEPAPERLDLDQLEARMTAGALDSRSVYAALERMGLIYGPAFQSITAIRRGNGEALARLRLPASVAHTLGDYVLHPSLLDGALQAGVGLLDDLSSPSPETRLPFALESLRIAAPCTPSMTVWVRPSFGSRIDDPIVKLDIDLCDEAGNVCAEVRGFASRAMSVPVTATAAPAKTADVLYAAPVWQSSKIAASGATELAEHHVVLCELEVERLESLLPRSLCVRLPAERDENIAQRYSACALACFERIQAILRGRPTGDVLLQIVVADDGEHALFTGLSALLKTAAAENPRFAGQVIVTRGDVSAEELAHHLEEETRSRDPLVRYREGGREVLQWQEVAAQASAPPAPFLDNGVYLITGGLGGLGLLFAKEIIEQTRDARVVLTGRAEAGDKTRAELDGSWTHGRVTYRQLDLGDAGQVRDVVGAIRDEHGRLDGILHSAGMLADRFILKKSGAEFANVLAPKVAGTFHLDQATRDIELDFFVLFSSVAGATGNPGQADYATANAFMDCYAAHRNELVAARQRYGRTLSINWPLWQSGGMRLDDTTRELLHQTTGMRPMQTPVGLQAFRRCLTLPHDQMLVVEGDLARIRRTLFGDRDVPVARREEPVVAVAEGLVERTQEYLRREFADLLKLPFQKIDPQAALEKYGIDSILAMRLTNQLEKTFGTLSKTLFFEYQTIAALAGYLIAAHPVVLRDKLGLLDDSAGARVAPPAVVEPLPSEPRRRRKRFLPAGDARNEIAIVGLAGRYPQAENLAEFWRNLQAGRDCITEIPLERWDHALYFDADRDKYGKSYSKWGGFISDVDKFDPLFFNISPKEAELIDPQERLFLETAWETIEDAGYTKESISGRRVGVFVGVMWGQYELFGAESLLSGNPVFPGSSHGSIANRVSYFFDFHGPSIALDTMCSSSLTAIHLACEELRRGEIEAAIAGGVNVTVHPYKYLGLSQGKFASSDGRCRSFGAGGDGYVPGEGVGAVLLKPLEAALRDGDQIHAVIRSSTVNHGGKTNGYTVPNPIAQGDLIREALRKANVDPRTLSYIETHGTGTSLGDPIEIAGLSRAFQGSTEDKQFCPIGSVKSNIGHLESAAGIAAVTKALLQIRHRQLVPSLHSEPLNPHIDFAESPFYVQTELADWARPAAHPRRVGVSSFGAGGSNAHLILEELDACETATEGATTREVFVLSARTPDALRRYAERVARFLENAAEVSLASVAYTSQVGRTPMDARLAVIASSMEELREKLNAFLRGSGPESEGVFQRNLKETEYDAADLIAGPAGKAFLDALLSHRELEKIARLWVLGADVDWSVMERQGRPRRVSLPTYPFEKERCWIRQEAPLLRVAPERAQQEISVLRQPAAEQKRRIAYSPQWTPEPLVAQGETRPVSEPLLMFDPSGELWQEMAAQAPGADSIVLVQYGAAFEELAPNRYVLDPEREEQFQALLDALRARALLPGRIIHCAAEIASLDVPHEVARHLSGGAYLLFHLCRALMREAQRGPVRIVSVFSGDSEAADPLGAATAGFLKTLTLEDPTVVAKAIETDRALSLAEKAALLWDELADRDWTAQEIRYRRVQGTEQVTRSVRTLARAEVPAEVGALPLRERGVYLITGGLGALGLVFAEYLAKNYQARLILTGRTAPNATQEQRLEQMKAGGAEVVFVQADVASRTDAERVVREAKSRFSAINGVIHAAGVNRDALLRRKTREEMDAVLAPKVHGTINLDLATSADDLDFFALFSSIAGVTGNAGQCDYAYGNRFLDAFAERREALRRAQQRSGRTVSIDWPLWEEGGMRIPQDAVARLEAQTGLCPLPTGDGLRHFEDLLRGNDVQGVALYGFASRIAAFIERSVEPRRSVPVRAETIDLAALSSSAEAYLKALIGEEIKLAPDRIGSSDRLESFGIDSVMIQHINARLERDLGALPKTLLYEHETVRELATYLLGAAREALIPLFGLAAPPEQPALPAAIEEAWTSSDVEDVIGVNEAGQGSTACPRLGQEALPAVPASNDVEDVIGVNEAGQGSTACPRLGQEALPAVPARDDVPPSPDRDELEAIAIIGIHGRYPHSASLADYWENLSQGRDLIDLVPPERWDYQEFYHPDPAAASAGKIYCKWGGFLEHYDKFDPHFFKISTAEARVLDPQERLFLESVWAAIEDAGYTRDRLRARFPKAGSANVGVFVGVTTNSYDMWGPEERLRGNFVSPTSLPWSIANRVSYFFDFNGPSLPVDTACSSSLVAIHLACESLRSRQCQMAIAGGVNLYLHPAKYQSLCQKRMVSRDGKCHSYGAGDDGFVPGEGVGTLVLKPLARAVEDGDRIYAVIRASAYDHSGRSNGYSAPNPNAQANLISDTLEKTGIHPETIGYVEGHGTGTQLGDSIEIAALTKAFQRQTNKTQFCPIGSVKANIGHSESAAGIAGLAKVVLQMQHGQLAPSIHSDEPNPNIEFQTSPFYLQHGLAEWPASPDHPRRALVNSFGAGGVNACVVLEEYRKPVSTEVRPEAGPCLFVLSARNEERLHDYADRLVAHLRREPRIDLADLCSTMQIGREPMEERLAIVVSEISQLVERLGAWAESGSAPDVHRGSLSPRRGSKHSLKLVRNGSGEQSLRDLASRWVAGEDVDWESLYPAARPQRVSVPTYPFARERYWVSDSVVPERPEIAIAHLHPLIALNSSTLKEVNFRSSLRDTAFYAVDHQVHDERIFPGAAFLEMACIAGTMAGEQRVRKIKDVVWMRPLSFRSGAQALRTVLRRTDDGVEYVISSLDDDNEPVVHSEGRLVFGTESVEANDRMPPQMLRAECTNVHDGASFYERFSSLGLHYGPSFQTIQDLYVNGTRALAKLRIADHLRADFGQFMLHPSLIDGALQTIASLVGDAAARTPYLPFALDEVEILKPVPQTCYAYAERADAHAENHAGVTKFNIRLLNESGETLVKFRNLYVRPLATPLTTGHSPFASQPPAKGRLISLSGGPLQ